MQSQKTNKTDQPFYKGNPFWGCFGIGTGILAGVVAATAALHWLVAVSWIFLTAACWLALAKRSKRLLGTAVIGIILAILLYNFDVKCVPDAPASLHTQLDILTPFVVSGDPYFPYYVGEKPNVGIRFLNVGDHAAEETYFGLGVDVCPNPLNSDDEIAVWNKSTLHAAVATAGILTAHSHSHYNTMTTREALTGKDVLGLNNGFLGLCATSRVVWKDATGGYCRYSFQIFYREPVESKEVVFNWHIQGSAYNREEKCTITRKPPTLLRRLLIF